MFPFAALTALTLALIPFRTSSQTLAEEKILTVTEARRDANHPGIPDLLGQRVTVGGRANVYSGVIHTDRLVVFLEDGISGIGLYNTELGSPIAEGDSVIATGTVEQFQGLTRLSHVVYRTVIQPNPMPPPPVLDISAANSEKYESRVITIHGYITTKWSDAYGSYLTIREHAAESDSMVVFLLARHKSGIDFGKLTLGDEVSVTGVLSQFNRGGTLDAGYEMYPRYPEDIIVESPPARTYLMIAYTFAAALILTLAWVLILRRQVERRTRELRESEGRFRLIFEGARDSILVLAENLMIEDANPAACALWGLPREAFLKKPLHEMFHVGDIPKFGTTPWAEAGMNAHEFEVTLTRDGGKEIHLLALMNLIAAQQQRRVILILRDITERRRAEEALRQSEEYHRMLFESSPLPMWVFEVETLKFLAVNEAAVDHYGYSREEFLSMKLTDIRPPEDVPDLLKDVAEDRSAGIRSGVWRHLKKDGTMIFVEISTHDFNFAGKEGRLVLANDITKRMAAERGLEESEERFRSVWENSADGMRLTDGEGITVDVNEAFCRLVRMPREHLVGRRFSVVYSGNDKDDLGEYRRRFGSGQLVPLTTASVPLWNGDVVELEISASMIELSTGGKLVLSIFRDVTDRKRAEVERTKLQNQLHQAQRMESIGTLAAGIAHDFNNILNIILGNASLLSAKPDNPQKTTERAGIIVKSVDRGANLVRQLLTYARKAGVHQEPTDINKLVLDTIKLLGETFSRSIEISTCLAPGLPLITADANQVNQVLLNLSVNARDAMPNGGSLKFATTIVPCTQIRDRFPQATSKSYIVITVKDSGTGMDELTVKRIFDPFFTTKSAGKGTGLGLSVALGIVESHRGFIDVKSSPGEGTEFSIYLPAREYTEESVSARGKESGPVPVGRETILFVDDEEFARKSAIEIMGAAGYKVITAEDGEDAVKKYLVSAREIDLVLSDMGMPKFTGEEVFKRIKEINPSVRFFLLTGFIEPPKVTALMKSGVKAVLMKPYSFSDLMRRMREVLDSKN